MTDQPASPTRRSHLRTPRHRTGIRWAAALAVSTIALTGCGSDTTTTGSGSSDPSDPTFQLGDFVVTLDRPSIPSGKVTINARNDGGEDHELVIVRADAVSDLPTKADGSVDEDKIAEADRRGEIEDVRADQTKSGTFELEPGTYVAFCNLVDEMGSGMMGGGQTPSTMMGGGTGTGHVHFALGMHQLLTVT